MPLLWPTPSGHPFPPSSARGLTALARGLVAVTRNLVNRPQVRVRMIVSGDEVIHLVSARKPAYVADASVITKDPLALRVPRLGEAHTAVAVSPLPGSHAITSPNLDTGASPPPQERQT